MHCNACDDQLNQIHCIKFLKYASAETGDWSEGTLNDMNIMELASTLKCWGQGGVKIQVPRFIHVVQFVQPYACTCAHMHACTVVAIINLTLDAVWLKWTFHIAIAS